MKLSRSLEAAIRDSAFVEQLFDRIPDVVFFIKDTDGRYVRVNQTLVSRCGATCKQDLLGRTAREVFPPPLGERFLEQDIVVASTGTAISQNLELHLYPTRIEGWCLTDKLPLWGRDNEVAGLAGISRDLPQAGETGEVAAVIEHVRAHLGRELRVDDLAEVVGLSVYQLNRRLRKILEITASQLVTKTRIDAASHRLRAGSEAIASIAHSCGYYDQSAFSRVFRRTVGLTPQQYRARHRS
jgi:transcriptional regulator GlxA family with amidase domain